ncbi:hypothetical protein BV898_14883 [Hypsibius exemplaris]|uniref:LysM domain-containing protein n=1 Tax=Hypsibius exemplaris TaxID=2072580 RepID=A0A9X6NJ64_HYPEX|nr:hypothetical protein BV898_14883 [Hypsibius exemplaris]
MTVFTEYQRAYSTDSKVRSRVRFSVVILILGLGIFAILYHRKNILNEQSLRYLRLKPDTEDKFVAEPEVSKPLTPLAEKAQVKSAAPPQDPDAPSAICVAKSHPGDTCEKYMYGYGIFSINRLKQMNAGLNCAEDIKPGTHLTIRNQQTCGTECTPELC